MVVTAPIRLGDLIKWETRREYCREQVTITHGSTITLDEGMGYPVIDAGDGTAALAVAATDGNTNALLLEAGAQTFTSGVAKTVTILRRGPAIVNAAKIVVTDLAAAAMTLADITGGLLSEGITLYQESDEITEQVT